MPRGVTLIEVLVALLLVSLLSLLAAPRWAQFRDRRAVDRAASHLAMFYASARYAAILRAHQVRLEFSADTLRAVYEGAGDSVFLERPGPERDGVSFAASRAVIRIAPNGLGYGPANTRLVLRRGNAADTITTSRLGRLKRW
jgi:prepilin-type N-terminal cleavage/methylation domain-containing protein